MKYFLSFAFSICNTLLWSQFELLNQWGYGGNQQEFPKKSTASEILMESNSNISGNKTIANFGAKDAWLVALDNNYESIGQFVFGSVADDSPVEIISLNNRKYLLMDSNSDIGGNKSMNNYGSGMDKFDFWLLKLDNNYQIIDQWNFGTSLNEAALGLVSFQNNLILYGASQGLANNDKSEDGRGLFDAWIICIDTNGNKLWDKTFGGADNDILKDVEILNDGMILVCQSNSNAGFDKSENSQGFTDIWIVKIDFNGNIIWDKTYGTVGIDSYYGVLVQNNSLFITGTSINSGSNNNMNTQFEYNNDAFILKINLNDGSLVHSNSYGGSNVDVIKYLFPIAGSHFLFVGSSSSNDGDITGTSYGMADVWVGILDSSLNIVDQVLMGSDQVDYVWHSILEQNHLLVYATSNGGLSGIKTVPNYGQDDLWMLKIGDVLSNEEEKLSIGFKIFPNPTADYFQIDLNQMQSNEIRILDMNGKLINSKTGDFSGIVDIDLSEEKSGIYVVQVGIGNGLWLSKKVSRK